MPDICTVKDIETATPRAVGLAQVPYEPGETVNVFIEPSKTNPEFTSTVADLLQTKFSPYVNLDFVLVDSLEPAAGGGLIHITDDTTGLRPGASGTCKRIGKKNPYIIIGLLEPRVVIHELAHAVGMIHELEHPFKTVTFDRDRLVGYYMARKNRPITQEEAEVFVDKNFFSNQGIAASKLRPGDFDPKSIMLYKLPADVTVEGVELTGNKELSEGDKQWLREAYSEPGTERSLESEVLSCPACPYDSTTNIFWIICVVVFAAALAVILRVLYAGYPQ